MKCKLCNGSGYRIHEGIVEECTCMRKERFRDFLRSRGFKLEHLTPWSDVKDRYKPILDKLSERGKNVLFMGTNTMPLFYSYMFLQMTKEKSTTIIESGKITSDLLEGNLTYTHTPVLGIILGFDVTTKIQEKVMTNFLFNRVSKDTTTIFLFPHKTLRKLETVYGTVFTELIKEGNLVKVEDK